MGRIQMENGGVNYHCSPRDLDFGFTSHSSTTSNFTASTSTSTSTSTHSSPTVSFNHRLSPIITNLHRPHRHHDPHWSAIRSATKNSPDGTLHLHHLKLIRQLGAGDLGRVFLCRIRNDHHSSTSSSHFALKVIDRNLLTPSKHAHLETEAKILAHLDHPFLPTLYARIDASHYTCFLIDYCPGGDLNTLIQRIHSRRERLPLSAVRFYAAEILVALEYLHSKGIVYRDLKPENILIREDGHIMLSDFDLCFTSEVTARIEPQQSNLTSCGKNKNKKKNHNQMEVVAEPVLAYSRSCVGTHEYLAPELVYGKGHGNGVDWWAFGVLIYEMMYGTTPFKGMDKEDTVRNIAVKEGVVFPCEVTGEEEMVFRDLIGRLLVKDPSMRLGCERGAAEIKRHLFFSGVNWALIREYTPPGMVTRGCLIVRKKSSGGGRSGGGISGKGHGLGQLSPRRRMRWGWRRLRNLLKNRRV